MDFNEYQKLAARTATFENKEAWYPLMYVALGVAGESGELIEKLKKVMRNDDGVISEEKREGMKQEIGDILWYLSQFARLIDVSFQDVAQANIDKTWDRAQRGVLKSEGDNR